MINKYKHTQIGYFLLTVYTIMTLFFAFLTFKRKSKRISVLRFLVMFAVKVLFGSLTVALDEYALNLSFGIGVIRKQFLLEEIESYRIVKSPWYYGFGIRYTPQGWLYNVSGLAAIELLFTNGKTCRIGTDEPEALAQALDTALLITV